MGEAITENKAQQELKDVLHALQELNERLVEVNKSLAQLPELARKVNEIHILHFPKEHFQTDKSLREKYLAEIILGIPRKLKK